MIPNPYRHCSHSLMGHIYFCGSSHGSMRRTRCVFRLLGYQQDREGPGGNQALASVEPLGSTLGSGTCVALFFGPAKRSCDARLRDAGTAENPGREWPYLPAACKALNAEPSIGIEPSDSRQHVGGSPTVLHLRCGNRHFQADSAVYFAQICERRHSCSRRLRGGRAVQVHPIGNARDGIERNTGSARKKRGPRLEGAGLGFTSCRGGPRVSLGLRLAACLAVVPWQSYGRVTRMSSM